MSEEFKKEEINGEAAEETKAAEAYRRSKSRNDSRAECGRDGKTAGNRRSAEGGRKENDNLQLGESENQRKDRRGE